MKKVVSTDNAPRAIGPYSQAVEINGLIFVSGQLGINPETSEFILEDVELQTQQAMENIKNILEAVSSSMDKIVKATIYLKNLEDYSKVNNIYAKYFEKDYPARVAVEVSKLPKDALVEISVIAYK